MTITNKRTQPQAPDAVVLADVLRELTALHASCRDVEHRFGAGLNSARGLVGEDLVRDLERAEQLHRMTSHRVKALIEQVLNAGVSNG